MQYSKWKWAAKGIAFGALFITAGTFVTMLLWNNLAAVIFGLPVLGFFQTLGLMILGRLLTGGIGPRGWRGGGQRGHWMRKRWQSMSPEQREQFMQRWGQRGWGQPRPAEGEQI
ncbi:MAG: hypothetical protein IT261_05190 [Saprospiraceae bacterium]|nr:hypothetical protein [Saprospiraceae bacterium]